MEGIGKHKMGRYGVLSFVLFLALWAAPILALMDATVNQSLLALPAAVLSAVAIACWAYPMGEKAAEMDNRRGRNDKD